MSELKVSDKGLIELICHEGVVPYPYKDSKGIWTYGVGHTAAAGAPDPQAMPKGVITSLKEVMDLFRIDLIKYENDVNQAVKVEMKQHEFDAAVSFHYNTGAIARASWVKQLNAGNKTAAIQGIMSWVKPVEVYSRRKKEQDLFKKGVYSNNGFVLVYSADKVGKLGKPTLKKISELLNLKLTIESKIEPVQLNLAFPETQVIAHEKIKKRNWWSRFF